MDVEEPIFSKGLNGGVKLADFEYGLHDLDMHVSHDTIEVTLPADKISYESGEILFQPEYGYLLESFNGFEDDYTELLRNIDGLREIGELEECLEPEPFYSSITVYGFLALPYDGYDTAAAYLVPDEDMRFIEDQLDHQGFEAHTSRFSGPTR